ncbi:MAG: hypothetical protein WBN92_05830 [Terriglobia bacterium]
MSLLLVTGIPGTGKTELGKYLSEHHRLRHVDMEAGDTLQSFVQDRLAFLAPLGPDVVITWGFHVAHSGDVRFLKEQGYFLVWLDGDRPSALRAFITRATVPEVVFYLQMFTIESQSVVAQIAPHAFLDPFREGKFRSKSEIAQELLALCGRWGAA